MREPRILSAVRADDRMKEFHSIMSVNRTIKTAEDIGGQKERDRYLEINVRDKSKIVEIWLTNVEKRNAELREQLKLLYEEYQAKEYLLAVLESGERDLGDAASDLLCYNRKHIAQLEVERKRQSGMAMGM